MSLGVRMGQLTFHARTARCGCATSAWRAGCEVGGLSEGEVESEGGVELGHEVEW